MTPRLRRLAALVAAFAPGRAERLLALVSTPAPQDDVAYASALARGTRTERLAALTAAFPAIAREGAGGHAHALWKRLAREAQARRADGRAAAVSRTTVRAAVAPLAPDLDFARPGSPGNGGTRRVPKCDR